MSPAELSLTSAVGADQRARADLVTVLLAREVSDDSIVVMGTGTPLTAVATLVALFTHAPNATYTSPLAGAMSVLPHEVSFDRMEAAVFDHSIMRSAQIIDLWEAGDHQPADRRPLAPVLPAGAAGPVRQHQQLDAAPTGRVRPAPPRLRGHQRHGGVLPPPVCVRAAAPALGVPHSGGLRQRAGDPREPRSSARPAVCAGTAVPRDHRPVHLRVRGRRTDPGGLPARGVHARGRRCGQRVRRRGGPGGGRHRRRRLRTSCRPWLLPTLAACATSRCWARATGRECFARC